MTLLKSATLTLLTLLRLPVGLATPLRAVPSGKRLSALPVFRRNLNDELYPGVESARDRH